MRTTKSAQRQGKRRSVWSECSGKNGEAMPEQVRSAERPSEPQANGLTDLLGRELNACLFGAKIRKCLDRVQKEIAAKCADFSRRKLSRHMRICVFY